MSDRRDFSADERAGALKMLRSRKRRAEAVAQLCLMFEPLVKAQAKAYRQGVFGADLDDLEQTARVGLLIACDTFDPKRGAFPSHAMWCIRDALSKYVETLGNPVKMPAWMMRRLPKMRRMTATLAQRLLREPTKSELAAALKMPEHAIDSLLAYEEGPWRLPPEISGLEQERTGFDHEKLNRRDRA